VAIIDEFQDTDATQWKIFETLYATEGRLFLVGDPKQAIYGFRGADVNAYLSAARQFEPLSLSTNRRSTEQLVSVLNELYSPRRLANPFVIDEIQYQPVKSAEPPPPVSSTGTNLAPFKILGIQNQTRTELTRERARRACERATAADIARLLASRATIGDRLVTPRSIAILTRKNDESLRMQQAVCARTASAACCAPPRTSSRRTRRAT
jgi:exodeoxyribonuclease V beta subunit